jgi:hypothetical protein
MDIICRNCGEPWENETLHEVAEELGKSYTDIANAFSSVGCKALASDGYGAMEHCQPDDKAEMRGVLADLLGDDLDGYSSTLEDMEFIGLL